MNGYIVVVHQFKGHSEILLYIPFHQLEEEIATLKQVLASKEKQHLDLKEKLGITPLSELRHNFSKNWNDMQSSTA